MKCKSKIVREMKRTKSYSIWPTHDKDNKLEVCGGAISLALDVPSDSCCCNEYCYCDRSLKVRVTCSRCRNGSIDEALQSSYPEARVNELMRLGLEAELA